MTKHEFLDALRKALKGLPESEIPAVGVFDSLSLGEALADYRKGLGLSQTELAERLGATSDAVSKWERGVISPDAETLVRAAELFGVSPSALYYGIKKTDETEQTVYFQKSRSKRGFWIALACSGAALAVAVTAVALIPRGNNYTLTVDGFTSYTVPANELFSPGAPEKKGYEFIGFVDKNGEAVELPIQLTSNAVVYPKFAPIAYDIDYWLGGGILEGEIVHSFTVEDGAVTLQIPQKAEDTFEGWYLTADYSGEAVTEIVCTGEEVRLYAKWSDESYTVRYVLNGGVCDGNPQTVTKAEKIALTEPIKGGHIFLGWYSSQEGGTRYEAVGGDGAKNITLYALWQKVDTVYAVNYVLNGGSVDGVNPTMVSHGETYRLLAPTKKGYDFVCWNDQADGNGKSYSWITGEKELTLYAVFAPKTYLVRYEYEGVYEKESNPSFIAYGETVSLNAVLREGYDFVGWYTKSSGGERVEKITAENIENISTLYAQYTPKKFSLSLFANGGSFEKGGEWVTEATLFYEYDTTLPLPECKREKYTFLGWYDNAGNKVTEITVKTYHAGVLTAKWFLAGGYEIIYELDGGAAIGELPAKAHSGEPQPLCGAKKEGYIFLGYGLHIYRCADL